MTNCVATSDLDRYPSAVDSSVLKTLQRLMADRGFRPVDLAARSEVSRATVYRHLSGEPINVEHRESYARALGISLSEFECQVDAARIEASAAAITYKPSPALQTEIRRQSEKLGITPAEYITRMMTEVLKDQQERAAPKAPKSKPRTAD